MIIVSETLKEDKSFKGLISTTGKILVIASGQSGEFQIFVNINGFKEMIYKSSCTCDPATPRAAFVGIGSEVVVQVVGINAEDCIRLHISEV